VAADKRTFALFSKLYHLEHNHENARILTQRHGAGARARTVVVNEPAAPLTTEELDRVCELPFEREAHPSYGGALILALEQIRWSIQILRGCSAGCSFCCITEHQGRDVTSRSEASILRELNAIAERKDFRGTITDLGGATANMWGMGCTSAEAHAVCRRASCVYPTVCQFWKSDHGPLVQLYRKARQVKKMKHVFVGSGVRYDLAHHDQANGQTYLKELITHHVSGQLKVAPEHAAPDVLKIMKKPGIESYERFQAMFTCASKDAGKEQYLVPYFITGHPGSTLEDTIELALWLKERNMRPRQVQDFIPTPMAVATAMFYTGIDPLTGEPVYTARDLREKRMMKALIFYWDAQHWPLAREALKKCGRHDLIGRGPHALVPPEGAADRLAAAQSPGPRQGGRAKPSWGRGPRRR
jgi:uncharacterized radical SAM protein YgiQ